MSARCGPPASATAAARKSTLSRRMVAVPWSRFMPRPTPTRLSASAQLDVLMPLHFFYAPQQCPLPDVEFLAAESLPDPWRHLLVHESDMTPRLRAHHQSEISLEVIEAHKSPTFVMRLVVLHRADDGQPVEFGAIAIQLEGFDALTRQEILEGRTPLGGILEARDIPHQSHPKAYFRMAADAFIAGLLRAAPGEWLYGRCNALCHPDGIVFADVVEILPK
jgi:hypothetical protein